MGSIFRFSWKLCSPSFGDEDGLCKEGDTQPSYLSRRYQVDKLKIHVNSGTECSEYLLIVRCVLGYWVMFPIRYKHLQWCPA